MRSFSFISTDIEVLQKESRVRETEKKKTTALYRGYLYHNSLTISNK